MINTNDFKPKSEILYMNMPKINGNNQHKGKTVLAMDGGYSTMKGVSPNKIFRFPSYAKKAPRDLSVVGKVGAYDIQFKDNKTGEIWLVGDAAIALMKQEDIDGTSDANVYSRYRYDSDIYRVLMSTGLALGLLGTTASNEIYLQTGLPSSYKKRDEAKLKSVLARDYDIEIKVGNADWVDFKFTLDEAHIEVMEQPQGTLCATAFNKDGSMTQQGLDIMSSNSIIYDIGFGTEDIFVIDQHYTTGNSHKTFTDTGMRAVFEEVINRLEDETDGKVECKVFELQKYLESGKVPYFDMDTISTDEIDIAETLEEVNRKICDVSTERLTKDFTMKDYKYLIVTGGTGESRFEQIRTKLAGIKNLKVLPGNINHPELSMTYSNVIGYYMLRHANLMKLVKQEG